MDTKVAFKKGLFSIDNKGVTAGQAGSDMDDSQELMLKAQKDAELAKAVARQAISQAFQQSETTIKSAEVLARTFDDALQGSLNRIQPGEETTGNELPGQSIVRSGRGKKNPNNGQGPLNAISDMMKSIFVNKAVDAETKKDFYNLVIRHSKQLRELVDGLVREQVHARIDKAIEEAKSDRIASRLAVQQAQDEISRAEAAAAKARSEAEASRRDAEEAIEIAKEWVEQAKREVAAEKKAAEVKVSQAQQQALSQAQEEIVKAKDEVVAAREAAAIAIKRAEDAALQSGKEAEEARNKARIDVGLAQEKAKLETEKTEAIRQRSQIAMDKALAEAAAAREEARVARRESQQAVKRAQAETRKAIEQVEREKKQIQDTVVQAQQQSYQDIYEEMSRVKEEAEATRKQAYESIVRAQEESRKAREEAVGVRRTSEEALKLAREEAREAREEAEKAKQSLAEVVARAKEDVRKAKEDAEASILMANETMKRARQDIIGMTIGEITRTRQELEAASQAPGSLQDVAPQTENPPVSDAGLSGRPDSDHIAAVLSEMRAPLHSISGFASLMLEDGVADAKTRKEFLSIVIQESESLNRLLDDLSGQLKPHSEAFPVEKGTVSPHKLITEAVQDAQGTDTQKKNVIILSIPGDLPAIEADGMRLKQVLLNLITDAIKSSPENSTIIVGAEARDGELHIQVKDRTGRTGDEGTSPGLHLCRQVVEAHGGRVWAESAAGQGCTFNIVLPFIPAGA